MGHGWSSVYILPSSRGENTYIDPRDWTLMTSDLIEAKPPSTS
jgi:hypothetical protein